MLFPPDELNLLSSAGKGDGNRFSLPEVTQAYKCRELYLEKERGREKEEKERTVNSF